MAKAKDEAGPQEGLADEVSTRVQDAGSAAQEKASELREQGSARLRDQFDQRSSQAGTQMRSLAKALRRSGDELGSEGNGEQAQQLTGQAADRIERLGGYLEQKSGDELMRDIETFARRRPWMLAGLGHVGGCGGGAVHEGVVGAALRRLSSDELAVGERRASAGLVPRPGRPGSRSKAGDDRRRAATTGSHAGAR